MQLVSYFEFSIFIFILKSHDLLEVLVRIFGLVASQLSHSLKPPYIGTESSGQG